MKIKKICIILCIPFCLVSYCIYKNTPIRTAIFRSFVKGNWYLISEKDTLYSFGYYGVKKWLINSSNKLKLLEENKDFCNNTYIGYLIGRSGVINNDYLYLASRSYLGGNDSVSTSGYINGKLLILKKNNLKILKEIPSDIKFTDIKIFKNHLFVSGLKVFDIYEILKPDSLDLIYKYRQNEFTEFQGITFFQKDSCTFIAFARFAEGISIWDITNPPKTHEVKKINIPNMLSCTSGNSNGLQCFDIEYKAPYLYISLAPMIYTFNKKNDKRGVITCDISDFNNIKYYFSPIAKKDWYKKKIGDPEPSYIDIYKNKLYTNFGEKGIAIFDISNPSKPRYEGIIDITNNNNLIQPIHINHRGILFAGDYYWPDIYSKQLND